MSDIDMNRESNRIFTEALYARFPNRKSLVQFLVDILDLSRESTLRRLRDEVYFTFEEVSIIASHLNLSIDRLIGVRKSGNVFFDLHMHKSDDPVKIYSEILQINTNSLEMLIDSDVNVSIVLNSLPYGFALQYENMAKFYYYKWYFHTQDVQSDFLFSDFCVQKEILDAFKRYTDISNAMVGHFTMLIDDNVFLSLIKELIYFNRRGLIKESELYAMQNELLEITDLMEDLAKNGNAGNRAEISIYVSAIDLDPNYSHVECNDHEYVQFWSPSAEVVTSYNPEMCLWQKKWIESLKRYATLITKCNEKEGIKYFDKQRAYIRSLSATELSLSGL